MTDTSSQIAMRPPRLEEGYATPTPAPRPEFLGTARAMARPAVDAARENLEASRGGVGDYVRNMPMAALNLADAAARGGVGAFADLVPGMRPATRRDLAREILATPEAFAGSVARAPEALDEGIGALSEVARRMNQPGPMPERLNSGVDPLAVFRAAREAMVGARRDMSFEELQALSGRQAEARDAAVAALSDAPSVRLFDRNNRAVVVGPGMGPGEDGKFRVTYFNEDREPTNHAVYETREEALSDALRGGFDSRIAARGPSEAGATSSPAGIRVFHASPDQIEGDFRVSDRDVGLHFANNPDLAQNAAVKSALERPDTVGSIRPQEFVINATPEQVADIPASSNRFDFYDILESLREDGRIDQGLFDEIYDGLEEIEGFVSNVPAMMQEQNRFFSERLSRDADIKALRYYNEFDAGPTWADFEQGRESSSVAPDYSYIVLDPSAVKRPENFAQGGAVMMRSDMPQQIHQGVGSLSYVARGMFMGGEVGGNPLDPYRQYLTQTYVQPMQQSAQQAVGQFVDSVRQKEQQYFGGGMGVGMGVGMQSPMQSPMLSTQGGESFGIPPVNDAFTQNRMQGAMAASPFGNNLENQQMMGQRRLDGAQPSSAALNQANLAGAQFTAPSAAPGATISDAFASKFGENWADQFSLTTQNNRARLGLV